ncbi:MAG: hypothetical protein ABIV36_24920, partial [Sphingobium limneticum]
ILEPGAISTVEGYIAGHPEISGIYADRNYYDVTMTHRLPQPTKVAAMQSDRKLVGRAETIFELLGEHVGYLSGNVIKRALWDQIVAEERDLSQFFNAWVHVYIMGRMMQRHPSWLYVAHPCVGWRSGNDSFLAEGMYKRLEIDVAGYDTITAALFGRSTAVYRHTMARILNHARFRIAHAKVHGAPGTFFTKARRLMTSYYRSNPSYWLTVYPLMLLPSALLRTARLAKSVKDKAAERKCEGVTQ